MTGLPANLSTGTVRGRFISAELLATGDVGPDGVPVSGTVTFTPSAPAILDATASPSPVTIIPKPVTVSLSANGEIVNPVDGSLGVQLLATDDVDGNPSGWTYKATFQLAGGLTIAPYSFSLPSGATVDLTTVTPVPDAGGTFYLVGPPGASIAGPSYRAGEFLVTYGLYTTNTQALATTLKGAPIYLPAGTYDLMAVTVRTAGAAGSTIRLGLYTAAEALVADFGTVAADTTGDKLATGSATITAPGWHIAVAVAQGVVTTLPVVNQQDVGPQGFAPVSSDAQFTPGGSLSFAGVESGALPASITAKSRSIVNHLPAIRVRKA